MLLLRILIFSFGLLWQFDLNDQLMAMFFKMEPGEMVNVNLICALKQEFVLRWRNIVSFTAHLRQKLHQKHELWCDKEQHIPVLLR